ncbi:nuclear transport factor 2 family protein [Pseudonocardia sp. NPDC049154]|uniref:nuclear transport factor 2 family protein n=1 Tax=Pseudonocardia sp. NPDC049154 TaxID=3155501 RepID=UPI0033F00027
MSEPDLAARIARLEARQEIGQLPVRYALAVDRRDLDAWTELFVPDVELGRHGRGREALRDWIAPQVATFYRSVHLICGHRIELGPEPDAATGQVYCRAEHEVGDRWVVMAIRYDDTYRRLGGEWLFARRRETHWYEADVTERPQAVDFDSWHRASTPPPLPGRDPSFAAFWAGRDAAAVTDRPIDPIDPIEPLGEPRA